MSELTYHYGRMRAWEMLPGLLVWGTFAIAILLSFFAPLWAIILIILFDTLWLFRVVYYVFHILVAWWEVRKTSRIDWMARVRGLPSSSKIRHLVFLPTYKEGVEILRATLTSLSHQSFPADRLVIVLAGEERDREPFEEHVRLLKKEFDHVFCAIFSTVHPKDLPGEIPGKGSNLHWSGGEVAREIRIQFPNWRDEDMIVTAFDVDTIAHPQYFAYLTYIYATTPNPTRSSYQPITLLCNNIWSAPAPVRIAAFGTTFWLMSELVRPERLWTFSSHSMPFAMLKDVGFWQKDIVSEDSRIFMQAFVHYHGDYRVTPLFLPVSMDTVVGDSYWQALKALYVQQRRWAWGVEHLPFIIEAFRKDHTIPWRKRAKYVFNHIEGMYTWATAPLLIFLLGWLPLQMAQGQTAALVQAAPYTLEMLMRGAMIGLFASALLSLVLLPSRPRQSSWTRWPFMLLQWILLPVTFIVFGAFPAIDAQTRFLLGRYLGFQVTRKKRA
jgi:hypothetical protein